ncbi:hypothetical protein [Massilia timonae]|uniref:hypothetical protein n=1 Tax=Massilia timonae TaxID=47229 RepID=UPI00289BEDA5|nr:hypothetical protein [Massilia timonae]
MLKAAPAKALEFRQAAVANDADSVKAFLADVQDAWARDIELHKAGFGNRRADVMVALDVLGQIACPLGTCVVPRKAAGRGSGPAVCDLWRLRRLPA